MSSVDVITLAIIGDVFPGNLPINIGSGISSALHNGKSLITNEVLQILQSCDFVIANLESPLLFDTSKPWEGKFAGSSSFTELLREMNVTCVSLANNHILEHGVDGLTSTTRILNHSGIGSCGVNEDYGNPAFTFASEVATISIASFSMVPDPKNSNEYQLIQYNRTDDAFRMLDKMDDSCFKVVSIHWGDEYVNIPSIDQITLARSLVDRGANLVIGHHAHVLQPIEKYNGGLILYNTGNFLFDMSYNVLTKNSMITILKVDKDRDVSFEVVGITRSNGHVVDLEKNKNAIYGRLGRYGLFLHLYSSFPRAYNVYYNITLFVNKMLSKILLWGFILFHYHRLSAPSKKEVGVSLKRMKKNTILSLTRCIAGRIVTSSH